MLYIVHIKDKQERLQLAADIKKILQTAKIKTLEYIPGGNKQIIKTDIGLKADGLKKKTLAQVLSQIERRGYSVINAPDPEKPGLALSAASPQQQQKTTGEITYGNITEQRR